MTSTNSQPVQAITKAQLKNKVDNRVFPDFVIQAFNECIAESNLKNSNDVTQDDVIDRIVSLGSVTREDVFQNRWLNVETFYRNAGWTVTFYKPPYNEDWKAYFVFT